MKNSIIKKNLLIIFVFFILGLANLYASDSDTERRLRELTPPISVVKEKPKAQDKVYYNIFYEPNKVLQGATKGRWIETTGMVGYIHNNVQGYFSTSQLKRIEQKDYIANLGSYVSFKDSYIHVEGSFGWNVSFIYNNQFLAEYGHKIINNLYGQLGYTFKDYPSSSNNTHLVSPGLIYYFGENYVSAFYGVSAIEGRGVGQLETLKGNFVLTDFLKLDTSVSYGQWLYDIYGFSADEELGYIVSSGLTLKLCEGVNFRVGYTLGMERPKFLKRGVNFNLAIKF